MSELEIGTVIRVKDKYVNWSDKHADDMYSVSGIFKIDSVEEALAYTLWKFSKKLKLQVNGIIVGDNGYKGDHFAYIVWVTNELGSDVLYIDPKDIEVLK